jgi:hypothetical protein
MCGRCTHVKLDGLAAKVIEIHQPSCPLRLTILNTHRHAADQVFIDIDMEQMTIGHRAVCKQLIIVVELDARIIGNY